MSQANTVLVAGHNYRVGKLDPFKQLHVFRRITPMLTSLGQPVAQLLERYGSMKKAEEAEPGKLGGLLQPVLDQLSVMSDDDVNYVLMTCLSVCEREESSGGFAPVVSQRTIVYADIDMVTMVRLTVEVIMVNIGNFFSTPH